MKTVNEILRQRNRISLLRNELNVRDRSHSDRIYRITERRHLDDAVCRAVYNYLYNKKMTELQKRALWDINVNI